MVAEENRTLYVAIPVYFVLISCAAFYSYKKLEQMKNDGVADQLTGHYLGGRAFGPVLIAGTVFASLFSGYTVVGIPNESFKAGFHGFRWMPSTAYIAAGYIGTGVRLRKASVVRNHSTPVDFITDRFRSQILRYTVVTVQAATNIIYLSAQVNALKSTFNAMFGFSPNSAWPVVVIMTIILAFEWAGGLTSVAITDAIQGFVMLLSFLLLPCVIKKHFGGWSDLDPSTYPRPDFYQTPSGDKQWDFWQFSLILVSFFALPHLIQRIYAARDLKSLKVAFYTVTIGPWITMFVGVFIGTVGVQLLADAGADPNPSSPFTAILEQVMLLGGFARGVAVIALTASLAAIMSTADSLIIATSQLFLAEVVWPFKPHADLAKLAWGGRIASLLATILALLVGIFWKEGISDLAAINFPVLVQVVPTFLVGLYFSEGWDIHPWCLAAGCWAGLVFVFAFFFGYLNRLDDTLPMNPGIIGLIIHVVVTGIGQVCHRLAKGGVLTRGPRVEEQLHQKSSVPDSHQKRRPLWDYPDLDRFGETRLTPSLLNKMMNGFPEPFKEPWYALCLFLSISMVTPLVAPGEPPLDGNDNFVSPPGTVRGLPWWFFKQILLCVIPYCMLLVTVSNIPDEYPFDAKRVDMEGMDPAMLELTSKELNQRTSYSQKNEGIHRRRSTLKNKMDELGLGKSEDDAEAPALPQDRRLSTFVLKECADMEETPPVKDSHRLDDDADVVA